MRFDRIGIEGRFETRSEGDRNTVVGYAAVYNSMSEDLGGFREMILPGAFRSVLSRDPDVRALVNHDTGRVLGRTSAGTLTLNEDETGLAFSLDLPPTPEGRAIYTSIERRDITGTSFAFMVNPEDTYVYFEGMELIREIRNISQLPEISIVTFPAYQATEVSPRSRDHILSHKRGNPRSQVNRIQIQLLA